MRVPFTSWQVIWTEPGFFDLSTNMRFATPQNINFAIAPANHIRDLSILGSNRQNKLVGQFIAARAFADRWRYGMFLKTQYEIESDLAEIYRNPTRLDLFPALRPDGCLQEIARDLGDLRLQAPRAYGIEGLAAVALGPAELCGFLFVAEGCRLLRPWLRKQAEPLGFGENFGARHLACELPLIRSRWASFVARINDMNFSVSDVEVMARTSEQAMCHIDSIIKRAMGNHVFANGRRLALHG